MSFLWSFGAKKKQLSFLKIKGTKSATCFTTTATTCKDHGHAFKKGVHYNMKVILRGDVMTGKSSLFERLQGLEFKEDYITTPEIQVVNIPWQYNNSQDIIKVEIWEVIDKVNVTKLEGIKLEHHVAQPIELSNVPESLSVLVLGNFADKEDERKVNLDHIHNVLYEHNQERIQKESLKPNLIRYAETSMKSGLGLKYIYDYLGVPFLQLMMETLEKQLELKKVEIVDLLETLDINQDVPESMQRRRGQNNFNQPSEPRLEHEELKAAWDQELEEIAADHAVLPTLPPPTSPVKSNAQMPLPKENTIPFETGEELADDWFGETEEMPTKVIESEPEEPSNPMVARDEDLQDDDYYLTKPYNQPMFKNQWEKNNVVSESEEEPSFGFSGEYEEIGGSDNPWSKEDHWSSQETNDIKKSSKKKHKKKKSSSQVRK
ncbi:unnamed protein product [Rhizopus stolonifer]